MLNKFTFILIVLVAVVSADRINAQELPVVGLAFEKHTGEVTAYDYSAAAGLVATVSYDRCLKVWDAFDMSLKATVNVPESMSGGYLNRCVFHPFNHDVIFVSGNTSALMSDERMHKGKVFFFYALDWKRNILLDKFGYFEDEVTDMTFSPNKSMMLVTSYYEQTIVYDTNSMAVIGQLNLKDEYLESAHFIDDSTFVINSDLFIRKFSIDEVGSIKRLGYIRNRHHENSTDVSYLVDNKMLFEYTQDVGLFVVKESPALRTVDLGKMKWSASQTFKRLGEDYYQLRDSLLKKRIISYGQENVNVSGTAYRNKPVPEMLFHEGDLYLRYGLEQPWKLTVNGLTKTEYPQVKSVTDTVKRVVLDWYDHHVYYGRGIFVDDYWVFAFGDRLYKRSKRGTFYEKKLPAPAEKMCRCANLSYVALSLKDGTVRFYDIETGTECLACFIDKDGNWIIWTPTGFYYSDDVRNGGMIEWRYQQFSQVVVKKPLERRERFFSQSMINKVLRTIFTPESTDYLSGQNSLLNEFRVDMPKLSISDVIDNGGDVLIEYSVSDYDVFRYGAYDINVEVDGSPFFNVSRVSRIGGGEIRLNGVIDYTEVMITLLCGGKPVDYVFYNPDNANPDIKKLSLISCGVEDFIGETKLNGTVSDAMDMADLISTGNCFGIPPMDVTSMTLLDDNVHMDRIREAVYSLTERSDDNSMTVFYYSGHGVIKDGLYYVLAGTGRGGVPDLLPLVSIYDMLNELPGKKMIILDACYSGYAVHEEYEDFSYFMSSQSDQVSVSGNDISGSLFTRVLKDIIVSENESGTPLTLDDLFGIVEERVFVESDCRQIPVSYINDDMSNCLIVR